MLSNYTNETLHISKFIRAHEKFLRMSNYWASSNPRNCFVFFTTMPHKAKLSQWITLKKSFPAWCVRADADARQLWHILSSSLMHPLHQFCICIVPFVLAFIVYVGQSVDQSLSTHDNKETEEWPNKCNWYCDGNLYFRTDSKGNLTSTRLFWKFFIHTKRSRKTLRRLPCRELHCLNKRYNFIIFLSFWKLKVAFHLLSDVLHQYQAMMLTGLTFSSVMQGCH